MTSKLGLTATPSPGRTITAKGVTPIVRDPTSTLALSGVMGPRRTIAAKTSIGVTSNYLNFINEYGIGRNGSQIGVMES